MNAEDIINTQPMMQPRSVKFEFAEPTTEQRLVTNILNDFKDCDQVTIDWLIEFSELLDKTYPNSIETNSLKDFISNSVYYDFKILNVHNHTGFLSGSASIRTPDGKYCWTFAHS